MVIQMMMMNGWHEAFMTPDIYHLAPMMFSCLLTCKRWMWEYLVLGHVRNLSKIGRKKALMEI